LIADALEKGPQIVTRRGADIAVIVSMEEWQRLRGEQNMAMNWKDVLLADAPRFELPLPKRRTN
jgi:antitoxin Phd